MTLKERIDIQQLAESDEAFRLLHIEMCRRDVCYFINTCLIVGAIRA